MGGTVSTGEDNDDLIDNLVKRDCITSSRVEHVFRAVDRAHYFTEECRDSAYKDTAWRSDNLHLSAPCIYSSVMENLSLRPGHSFLNIGSGTGYISTMAGLIIESSGVNHGVELFQDVIDYAHDRLAEFTATSTAVDQFDFCQPQFVCGNGLLLAGGRQYDRVYCGARCPLSQLSYLKQLLKVGGVLVVPVNDHLKRIERRGENRWEVEDKLSVSFAGLIEPSVSGHKTELTLPPLVPASLQELCRTHIRRVLRARLQPPLPAAARAQRPRRRPTGQRSEQARRIQRFVLPLLGAAASSGEDGDAGERSDREPEEPQQGESRDQQEQPESDHSEDAHMELAGPPAPEEPAEAEPETAAEPTGRREENNLTSPRQQEASDPASPQQQKERGTSNPQRQEQEGGPADQWQQEGSSASPQHQQQEEEEGDTAQSRASLKRSSEEGVPGAGAGPSDTQKRGRRDKLDSGLGDTTPPSPQPPPPRDHSEPENGVAASSDGEDDDDESDDGMGGGRRLLLLPPPSRWGGRSARLGTEFATELSRFLAAGSDEEEEGGRRAGCPFSRRPRRYARPSRHAVAEAARQLSERMRTEIAALPLPPPLRLYLNMGRPL